MKKRSRICKKYQILSKNTTLFAEILNDNENNQTKLIKVDLNNYETQRIGGGFKSLMFNMIAPKSFGVVGCARPMMMCGAAMPMMNKMIMPNKMMTRAVPKSSLNETCAAPMNNSKMNFNINSNLEIKRKKDNNEIRDDLTRLIMSQDIIEGSWNENGETKQLINIVTQDKFNKISNKVKGLNKGLHKIKIIYTLLVIYYLNTKHSDKLNDYRLIINKGKKFLMKQGIKYEDFIIGI